jgi:hypothetical protein
MFISAQMRETLMAITKAIRKMHGLSDGYMTPERSLKFKSKEDQIAEKASLAEKLKQHLQNHIQVPQVSGRSDVVVAALDKSVAS